MRLSRKSFFIILLVCAVISAGVYAAYALDLFPGKAEAAPELQTTTVRTGDLLVLVTATGNVQPVSEVALSFRTGGLLAEMDIEVGDSVEAGQELARLDTAALERAVAQAEIGLRQAEINLAIADASLKDATGWGPDQNQVAAAEASLANAEATLEQAQSAYDKVGWKPEISSMPQSLQLEQATNSYNVAQANLDYLYSLSPDVDLARSQADLARLAVEAAQLNLAAAQESLANASLHAPFDGIVTAVNATAGETVGTSPVLVLSTQDQQVVRFYVEEGDIDKVKVGNHVQVTFEGYPDLALEGEVYQLEPAMVVIDSAPTLIAWASLPSDCPVPLFSGMSADVEIVSGEAHDALLVPVAALRELTPGSYAVFVVQPDGELVLTPVEVGLQDLTNAEIVEGLEEGDVISTGSVVTQ